MHLVLVIFMAAYSTLIVGMIKKLRTEFIFILLGGRTGGTGSSNVHHIIIVVIFHLTTT